MIFTDFVIHVVYRYSFAFRPAQSHAPTDISINEAWSSLNHPHQWWCYSPNVTKDSLPESFLRLPTTFFRPFAHFRIIHNFLRITRKWSTQIFIFNKTAPLLALEERVRIAIVLALHRHSPQCGRTNPTEELSARLDLRRHETLPPDCLFYKCFWMCSLKSCAEFRQNMVSSSWSNHLSWSGRTSTRT